MAIYAPVIKKEDIKKGLLILDVKFAEYPVVSDKGPGIVSFHDSKSGKYIIYFFEQGIETGLLEGDYHYGTIMSKDEAVAFFENRLFAKRERVADLKEKLNLEARKLKNSEKAFKTIPELIKKYSE